MSDSTNPDSTSTSSIPDDSPLLDDDYKATYLLSWNNSLNPKHVSCRMAFDIFFYCLSPTSQLRHMYRYGTTNACVPEFRDLKLCAKVRSLAGRDPGQGRELLRENRRQRVAARGDDKPHVWKLRDNLDGNPLKLYGNRDEGDKPYGNTMGHGTTVFE